MSSALTYFRKFGGFNLIKQYWRGGVLLHAIMQFLLTGKSKTGLELLRLSVSLKTKQNMDKRYGSVIKKFKDNHSYDASPCINNKTIWVLWWQGMENAPQIVKVCYASLVHNFSDWEIVLLTEDNYKEYVSLPEYIIEKKKKSIIGYAHLADIIRLELLIKYGGLWVDATVFCSGEQIPQSIIHSDLFVFQSQKPGADGRATLLSNWLIYAKPNQKILKLTLYLIYEYWKRNNYFTDYFFFHHFFTLACETYPDDAKKIPPFCNSVPHILQLHLFEQFDELFWNDLKKMTCFHKLTYKLDTTQCNLNGTYYKHLIQE